MVHTLLVVIPGELYRCGRPTQVETLSPIMVTPDSCVASPGRLTTHTSHLVRTLAIARCRYGRHLAETGCILTSSNIEYLAFPGHLMVSVSLLAALMDRYKPGTHLQATRLLVTVFIPAQSTLPHGLQMVLISPLEERIRQYSCGKPIRGRAFVCIKVITNR